MNKTYLSQSEIPKIKSSSLPLFVKATARSEGKEEQGIALSWLWLGGEREFNED